MTSLQEIKERLAGYNKILPVGKGLTQLESERRAGEFLTAMSYLLDLKHTFGESKISALSIQNITYAEELGKCTGKTVTENKVTVEATDVYIAARTALELTENDISYLKAAFDLYSNAHIFYRNLAKGENG